MRVVKKISSGFLLMAIMWCMASCDDKTIPLVPEDTFDKSIMLTHFANNIIVPAYAELSNSVLTLKSNVIAFDIEKNTENLKNLKASFLESYQKFQEVSLFDFGPAANISFSSSINLFPTDTQQIENNFQSNSVDFESAANIDAIGFPAIEYVLFAYGNEMINNPTSEASQAQRAYLKKLIDHVDIQVNNVYQQWVNSYSVSFIAANGNDVGSSIGLLTNAFSKSLEKIKNVKLGIPLGKQTLNNPRVDLVEGKFAKVSAQLAKIQTQSLYNFYLGNTKSGQEGIGFDDYLLHLNAASNGQNLHSQIVTGFELAISQLTRIPDPMAETILSDDAIVQEAYKTFQSTLIRLIKVDMSSSFGVQISYVDNDGD
jgi:predicted lipoprotein